MVSEPPNTELGFRALLWHWVRRPGWSVAAPVLLIAFTGIFAWQIFFAQSELDKGLAALNATYRELRPLEARLSGFSYAPYDGGKVKIEEKSFKLAENFLIVQTKAMDSPATVHARGKFYLVSHKLEEALQAFETALKLNPNDASLLNDLGVTWMEKATQERASSEANQHFAQSRAHLQQARQQDPRNLAVLFNLALLDFRQGLWKQAAENWEAYLQQDGRSAWAQEAQNYLNRCKTLQQPASQSHV